jgi:hypothetical protein
MSTKTYTENPDERARWAERKRKIKYIQSDQPAWKPGGASATPKSRKIPVFDYAVALCTMQNELLVISNLTWQQHTRAIIILICFLFTPFNYNLSFIWLFLLSPLIAEHRHYRWPLDTHTPNRNPHNCHRWQHNTQAPYPNSSYTEIPDEQTKWTKREKGKKLYSQTSRLENLEEQLRHTHE